MGRLATAAARLNARSHLDIIVRQTPEDATSVEMSATLTAAIERLTADLLCGEPRQPDGTPIEWAVHHERRNAMATLRGRLIRYREHLNQQAPEESL